MLHHILIFTDDNQLREAIRLACCNHGCQVDTATSLDIATGITNNMPVCILIADATVQDDDDGITLAVAMHQRDPTAICFLLVENENSELLHPLKNEPWLTIIPKPVQMLKFAVDIVDAIEKSTTGKA